MTIKGLSVKSKRVSLPPSCRDPPLRPRVCGLCMNHDWPTFEPHTAYPAYWHVSRSRLFIARVFPADMFFSLLDGDDEARLPNYIVVVSGRRETWPEFEWRACPVRPPFIREIRGNRLANGNQEMPVCLAWKGHRKILTWLTQMTDEAKQTIERINFL